MKITTLFVGAGLLSASIISCQKEEIAASEAMPSIQYAVNGDSTVVKTTSSSETKLKLSQVPVSILRYLSTNYPNNVFVEASKSVNPNNVTTYKVKIKVGATPYELKFDDKGVLIQKSQDGVGSNKIAEADLLPAIKEYIKANFAGFVYVSGEKYVKASETSFEIKIKSATGLIIDLKFDAKGVFKSSSSSKGEGSSLKDADLLTAIREYLKATYPGYTFVKAQKYVKANVISFEVKIKTADGKTVELKFDANGKLISPTLSTNGVTVLKESDLPEAIKTYLKTKYTSYTFVSAKKVVSNNDTNYLVSIKAGATNVELKFNSKGELISPAGTTPNNEISADKLLPEIKTYLEANFKGYTFVNALKITADKVDYYFVNFKLANVTYQVKFDSKGVFMSFSNSNKEEVLVLKADQMESAIKEYLNKNYKGYSFVSARKNINASVITYVVVIKLKDVNYTLIFDAKGKFVELKK